MASRRFFTPFLSVLFVLFPFAAAVDAGPSGHHVVSTTLSALESIIQPKADAAVFTFVASGKLVKADGLATQFAGATIDIAYQPPDRLRIAAHVNGADYIAGRVGDQLWVDEPSLHFAVLGQPGELRFKSEPDSIDTTTLGPFHLPMSRAKLQLLSWALHADLLENRFIDKTECQVVRLTPRPGAAELLGFDTGEIELWSRCCDDLPARIIYSSDAGVHVQADITDARRLEPWPVDAWKLHPADGDQVATVAVSHLMKMLKVGPKMVMDRYPSLDSPDHSREVIATEGRGRLEMIDGTRVLFLKGTPAEMGHQHGVLLKKQIHEVADRILYGVGVGSSFVRGAWFLGEIESASARLKPFMDPAYLEEEKALAEAADIDPAEAELANFFPELFHCSGFAIFGKASGDEHLYHGRVLDYLRGVGLEQNAVVIVNQPEGRHAWVNVGYAGFVGSVTAMNDHGISMGEMGGGGYGQWDGKPMAHLIREVMEKASTLDEAIAILRDSPRTCHYYYVIADGKAKTAVGVSASPKELVMVKPGEFHPLLPHPLPDAVMLSAGERYQTLSSRVKENYGHFDVESALKLMNPPVCMKSNIQSVLFMPDTLDFFVASADGKQPASLNRYTHYNLSKLLKDQ